MKVLITGGAGFIGSYLAEELIKEGNDVTVFDNFSRGKEENISSVSDRITLVKNETINIGSGKGISIEDLASKIKKITKSDSEIIYEKERKEEAQKFVADVSKAKKLLGWKPKTGLEAALKKIIR